VFGLLNFLFDSTVSGIKWLFRKRPKKKEAPVPKVDLRKRFELMGRMGQGSMSKVWRARDRSMSKVVVVKILDKVKTAKFEARFAGLNKPREGAVSVALRHKNIVHSYEHAQSLEGEPFIAMELIDGVGLNYLVETRSERLEGNRIHLLVQIAEALEYMHKHGWLHRDICPRNVMVTNDNTVKLIDFGLTIPNTPDFCKPGNRTGSANYLAPELIRRVATDQRVDLFALGVTAYEVFTFGLPWEKSESLQILLSHMHSPGRDPRELRPDLDDKALKFLQKAIEREPARRFQTATEFREALLVLPKKY
jgi:serine/threonine protein kinase